MQYEASSPQHYLELLEEDWRKEKLLEVRELILNAAPELEEYIDYKMLNYKTEALGAVFALNAQKHYVSLYVGSIEKIPHSDQLLEGYNLGKGCIRIKKSNQIHETGLPEFIHRTLDLWRAGEDVNC